MMKLANIKSTPLYSQTLEWLNQMEFEKTVKSSYAPNRLERWFKKGSNLQSIVDNRAEVTTYENPPLFLDEYAKTVYPDYDSILVCKGDRPVSDTSIDWHRDHGHFVGKAVMLNFGYSEYGQMLYSGERTIDILEDGDVVEIDTKIVHKSSQLSNIRYNVTLRKLKTKFATNSLF